VHALLGASKIEEARALSLSCCVLAAGNGRLEPPKSDQPGRAAFYQYMLIGENEFTEYEWRTLMHELTMYTSLFILHVIDTRLNARITHQFRVEESNRNIAAGTRVSTFGTPWGCRRISGSRMSRSSTRSSAQKYFAEFVRGAICGTIRAQKSSSAILENFLKHRERQRMQS